MGLKYLLLTICICISLSYQKEIKISVYYESLCPDSRRFILNELYPTYLQLSSYINIDFIPYGKASQQLVNGVWQFRCQHGANECIGNAVQAVALNLNYSEATNMEFVHCMMNSGRPHNSGEVCANGLSEMSWLDIETQLNNGNGNKMLAAMGDRTHSLDPPATFIPTIIFNDEYEADLHWGAIDDLRYIVCLLLDFQVEECHQKVNKNNKLYK